MPSNPVRTTLLSEEDVRVELERCGFPHGEAERYQLFVVSDLRGRRLLATAASMEAIGTAIRTLGEEGELDGGRVGILDRAAHSWVVNPWAGSGPAHV